MTLRDAELRRDAYGALRWGFLATHPHAWEVARSEEWLDRIRVLLAEAGLLHALPHAVSAREAAAAFPDADSWQGAYQDAFGRGVRVSPYEADHTSPHAFMQTREMADVAGFYGAFGYAPVLERPDHLGAELEFLHVLAHRQAALARDGDADGAEVCLDATRKFIESHTGRFAAPLLRAAQEKDVHPYFVHILELTRAFVERDVATLDLRPAPITGAPAAEEPDEPACAACPRVTEGGPA